MLLFVLFNEKIVDESKQSVAIRMAQECGCEIRHLCVWLHNMLRLSDILPISVNAGMRRCYPTNANYYGDGATLSEA